MGKYIPPDILKELKKIDLVTYFRTYMPNELVKASNNEYTTRTHDSLRMSNGLWNWCSRGFGGRNAIDFVQKTQNMNFNDAANYVLEKMQMQTPIFVKQEQKSKEKHLILPEKNATSDKVKAYLRSRGIDEEIIEKCIKNNLIYEEKHYHNVVFVGYDELGNAKYAGCRSTNESKFKADATGSDKMYSFRLESKEKTDTLFIFEGAIDLLSYATLFKLYGQNYEDKTFIALAGVYQPSSKMEDSKVPIAIQNYLKKHPEIKKIYLCLDNDIAGRNATKALQIVLPEQYEVIDRPPKSEKDYNEYLCRLLGINRTKKLNKERTR